MAAHNAEQAYAAICQAVEENNTSLAINKLEALLGNFEDTETERFRKFRIELIQLKANFNRVSAEYNSQMLDRGTFRREMARIENSLLSLADDFVEKLGLRGIEEVRRSRVLKLSNRKSIFISYRRQDSIDVTGRIYDRLRQRFAAESVYKDVDSIPYGVNFRTHVTEALQKCNAAVIVIGPDWLSVKETDQRRRIESQQDLVRIEVEIALKHCDKVLPVLVRGARMPDKQELPDSISPLASINALVVRPDPDFHSDVDRLVKALEMA
jgi:hypothetical protein